MHAAAEIVSVQLIVGLEVHVELSTRTKMFSRVPSPACREFDGAGPNSLIDPIVLGLPGALPVPNRAAVEMAMMVGLALNCSIADTTKWDRKGYFYPDLPKGYQISQYDLPLCFDGSVELPAVDAAGFPRIDGEVRRIGIVRAHLEEDAGKLLHDAPGGHAIDFSIVDLSRAGTPLLEVVTQPDFRHPDDVVLFARTLRNICRFLGVTEGVMQKGHMRFEPNINCELRLSDGHVVKTPIVEIKNLNSFRSLKGAIEYELAEQPRRWQQDRRVLGKGTKVTRGWDDVKSVTYVQREKEDAHDYRYFPDPDLPMVRIDAAWKDRVAALVPELPMPRFRRYVSSYSVGVKEAWALVEEREACLFYEACIEEMVTRHIERDRAGKVAANILLQSGARRANERGVRIDELGITPAEVGAIGAMREQGKLGNQAVDDLFGAFCDDGATLTSDGEVEAAARSRGLLIVRDDAALERWIDQVIAANPKVADDVRGGKVAAAGRLVGEVMKLAGGSADAKTVREAILKKLS
ncbi:MAG TPA: Asp-tRNA(Asn)/Glu-tRNA(Gln) amidotransferase subunit GatB [Phycisphaerales bacterium]|nr:Asp-tRNA(Asn)/Glu-tRNA(Gln) amidotransferase subunit GatB [Phycisphaerales bacterium]